MRHLCVAVALFTALAAPALAASSAALPYNLTFSPNLSTTANTGTVKGTFGGVPVTGAYTGTSTSGTFTLTASGKTFASGTYTCGGSGCAFTGTVAGKSVTGMSLTSSAFVTGTGKATSGVFPNHGAWVSAVAGWANANLSGSQRGQIVSAAARIEGSQASNGRGGSPGGRAGDSPSGRGGESSGGGHGEGHSGR